MPLCAPALLGRSFALSLPSSPFIPIPTSPSRHPHPDTIGLTPGSPALCLPAVSPCHKTEVGACARVPSSHSPLGHCWLCRGSSRTSTHHFRATQVD